MRRQNFTKVFNFSFIHRANCHNPAQNRSKALAIGFIGVFLSSTIGYSVDFQSSRTMSLAQAGRGGAMLNDTITLNPALLGFQPVAAFSGTYNWLGGSQMPDSSDRTFNVSVIDGKNEYVNAGLSFTRKPGLDLFHLGVAKKVSNAMSFGLQGKRYSTRNSKGVLFGGYSATGYDGGLSAALLVPPAWTGDYPIQIGLTSENLLHREQDEKYIGPRQLAVGTKINFNKIVMLYGDYIRNFSFAEGNFATYAGGLEFTIANDFFVRGGMMGMRERIWSFGGGWVGPRMGISYGYQNKREKAERSFDHAVTMDIYM